MTTSTDYSIQNNLQIIEKKLLTKNHNFSDSLFIQQISSLIDSIFYPKQFNKTIFNHIIDFSNLNINKPIKLEDFFKGYLSVYESMLINKEQFEKKISLLNMYHQQLNNKLNNLNNDKNNNLINNNNELFSNSRIIIHFKILNEEIINNKLIFELKNYEKKEILINYDNNSNEIIIPLKNYEIISNGLYVYYNNKIIDHLNIWNILNKIKTNNYENNSLSISYLWINSEKEFINVYIEEINNLINNEKEYLNMLNDSLKELEFIFKEKNNNNIKNNTELEITNNIENLILNLTGNDIIIWDNLTFYINMIILIGVLIQFLTRSDYISLLNIFLIFFTFFNLLKKNILYKILKFDIITIINDLIYFIININKKNNDILEKIINIIIIIIIFLKTIQCFSLWKMALEYKIYYINNYEYFQKNHSSKSFFRKMSVSPKLTMSNNEDEIHNLLGNFNNFLFINN